MITGRKKEQELKEIKDNTIDMFRQVAQMMKMSKYIIVSDHIDKDTVMELIDEDEKVDSLQNDIIVDINNVIVTQQPKAIDLRLVLGTYQLVGDLERIGDYCKNFAKTLIKTDIDEIKHQKLVEKILSELLIRMEEITIAYDKLDHNLAKTIARRDIEIDTLTKDLIKDINKKLVNVNDEIEVKSLTRILTLAKTFERSGDHIVNICEQVSYIKKGQIYHYS